MNYAADRANLIKHLSSEIRDSRVLEAMSRVPRERFVSPDQQRFAYQDTPLPIGFDQTISQPFIIALMTQALELGGDERVLEVGTGSGYQTAILAELARTVVTVERIPQLVGRATETLRGLGYGNIRLYIAEETLGWLKEAPYGAILVTGSVPRIPVDLLSQLAVGGRMVVPIGSRFVQELCKITRFTDKDRVESLCSCHFVPIIGKGAWEN